MVFKRNYKGKVYKEKQLTLKKLGWKRIARNTERFGWFLKDATKHTEITETTTYEGHVSGDTIYINPKTHRTSKTRVWLTFYRSREVGAGVGFIEFLYNLAYYIRKISLFCMPFLWAATFVLLIIGFSDIAQTVIGLATTSVAGWIGGIIWETIWARIAGAILKNRKEPVNLELRHAIADCSQDGTLTLRDCYGELCNYKVRGLYKHNGTDYADLYCLTGKYKDDDYVFRITREGGQAFYDLETDFAATITVFARFLDD